MLGPTCCVGSSGTLLTLKVAGCEDGPIIGVAEQGKDLSAVLLCPSSPGISAACSTSGSQ